MGSYPGRTRALRTEGFRESRTGFLGGWIEALVPGTPVNHWMSGAAWVGSGCCYWKAKIVCFSHAVCEVLE